MLVSLFDKVAGSPPNFLVRKFSVNGQFPQIFGRIVRKSTGTVRLLSTLLTLLTKNYGKGVFFHILAKIFHNTYFIEHIRTIASDSLDNQICDSVERETLAYNYDFIVYSLYFTQLMAQTTEYLLRSTLNTLHKK